MAARLAERVVVLRRDLIDIPGAGADPHFSVTAAHGLIDAWCAHGLAQIVGQVVIAADPAALFDIATFGWAHWLAVATTTGSSQKAEPIARRNGRTDPSELSPDRSSPEPGPIPPNQPSPRPADTIYTRRANAR
ncbi:hypothetical protein [Catellatospora sp. IY07-71]|uniref:hypothetical protein n=1 Tax=Catellatospora sp. IY07-71 TaxID=2728827 RepID=UPI001BB366C1|nr:hypothetical protein [Catellatospora sp. IY07-71]